MNQIPLPETAEAENRAADEARDDGVREIAPDVGYRQLAIVNVVFYGPPAAGDGNWVLIDTGVFASGPAIRHAARARFGGNGRPACIIQTHGHFDHVGLLETLSPPIPRSAAASWRCCRRCSRPGRWTCHGPPMYFTPDWAAARESVRALAALSPETVITGHGAAMRGPEMRKALDQLAREFDDIAVPKAGRYAAS